MRNTYFQTSAVLLGLCASLTAQDSWATTTKIIPPSGVEARAATRTVTYKEITKGGPELVTLDISVTKDGLIWKGVYSRMQENALDDLENVKTSLRIPTLGTPVHNSAGFRLTAAYPLLHAGPTGQITLSTSVNKTACKIDSDSGAFECEDLTTL